MKLKNFDYSLPQSYIAQYPLKKRDKARLMVLDRRSKRITHDVFSNIADYLPDKSTLVVNDSKVIPARLLGKKERTSGKVELFLLKKLSDGYSYEALLRPLRKIKIDEKIIFNGSSVYAQLKDKNNRIVRFNRKDLSKYLDSIGHIPLPPYIKRQDNAVDRAQYQTVYARNSGSVASPTAGLHFTNSLLRALKQQGHKTAKVTLHINYATFKPVEEDDIRSHKMHAESYNVNQKALNTIESTKIRNGKIVAVGTTSCRVLETIGSNREFSGATNLFIYPGYKFRMVDALITNFHLPRSTLLMLVCAFGSHEFVMKAYREAINKKYRFYSYGDCMLII